MDGRLYAALFEICFMLSDENEVMQKYHLTEEEKLLLPELYTQFTKTKGEENE